MRVSIILPTYLFIYLLTFAELGGLILVSSIYFPGSFCFTVMLFVQPLYISTLIICVARVYRFVHLTLACGIIARRFTCNQLKHVTQWDRWLRVMSLRYNRSCQLIGTQVYKCFRCDGANNCFGALHILFGLRSSVHVQM